MYLNANSVHIWLIRFAEQQHLLKHAEQILTCDEKSRCQQFRFLPHQARFRIMRTALRLLLHDYLAISPQAIHLQYNNNGKPHLEPTLNSPILFNISHSHEFGVIAIANQLPIGIDIEYVRPCQHLAIAKRFFHQAEYQLLLALAEPLQTEMFCQLWAKKEALVKALGASFSLAKQFSATTNEVQFHDQHWQLQPLQLVSGYKAALATSEEVAPEVMHF